MLYEDVVEVDERIQFVHENDRRSTDIQGISGDYVRVLKKPNLELLRENLKVLTILFHNVYPFRIISFKYIIENSS